MALGAPGDARTVFMRRTLHALDRLDTLHPLDRLHDVLQLLEIPDGHLELVDRTPGADGPADRLDDADPRVADHVRDGGQHARPVIRDDLQRGGAAYVRPGIPGDVDAPLAVEPHHLVAAGGVDGAPAPPRDEADDGVAGDGVAAAAEADEHVLDAADPDPLRGAPSHLPEERGQAG